MFTEKPAESGGVTLINPEDLEKHHKWMKHALMLAERSRDEGEVPVGAIIVKDDELIAEGWNRPIETHDATAHAEIMVIREAGRVLNNYRLPDTRIYVTLEPCTMCAGAIVHARIGHLFFGAPDPRTGTAGSAIDLFSQTYHNHQVDVTGGIMQDECGEILTAFFKARRK